jgi:uncharacterized membrane protein YdjX (TVP38/TMEM64 family)
VEHFLSLIQPILVKYPLVAPMVERLLSLIHPILTQYPMAAPLVFIGVHTLMAVLFLPCSPMTLIAGALWGSTYGLFVSICAAMASSATTFLLSRSFLHGTIERLLVHRYPKIANLLAQVAVHDWKIIAVIQMNPLIPASAIGYVFGLSQITFIRYLLFSGIFMLPLQALFVVTGHSVTSLFAVDGNWRIALALIFLVITATSVTKYIYRKLCQLLGVKNGA